MNTEENNRINKKQQEVDAKKTETSLENVSDKTVRESKKETNVIGDSDSE